MGGASSTEVCGVRVFKVTPGSPASEAGLEVYFDFIMEVNGTRMDPSHQQSFGQKVAESENGQAKMVVYNARVHATREVIVMPRKWGGTGLLGATVRFDTTEPEDSNGIRVLEVFPNSPAAHAGIVPYQDFLLGTAQCAFREIDELVESVSSSINKPMQVYVYNGDSETVREITLVPNNDWGGEGCIGCDIGTGLLHRIPPPRRKPGTAPAPQVGAVSPPVAAVPPPVAPVQPSVGSLGGTMPAPVPGSAAVPQAMPSTPPVVGGYGVPAAPTAPVGNDNVPAISTPAWNPSMMKTIPETTGALGALPATSPAGTWPPTAATTQPAAVGGAAPTLPASTRASGVAGVSWPPPRNSQQEISPVGAATPKAPPSTPAHGLDPNTAGTDFSALMHHPSIAQHAAGLPAGLPLTEMPAPVAGSAAVL